MFPPLTGSVLHLMKCGKSRENHCGIQLPGLIPYTITHNIWEVQLEALPLLNTLWLSSRLIQDQHLQNHQTQVLLNTMSILASGSNSIHPENNQLSNEKFLPTTSICQSLRRQSFSLGMYNLPFTSECFKFHHFLKDQMLCPFCSQSKREHYSVILLVACEETSMYGGHSAGRASFGQKQRLQVRPMAVT